MADEWLESYGIQTDLYYSDPTIIDFRDYAVLAENWLEEQLWPSE